MTMWTADPEASFANHFHFKASSCFILCCTSGRLNKTFVMRCAANQLLPLSPSRANAYKSLAIIPQILAFDKFWHRQRAFGRPLRGKRLSI